MQRTVAEFAASEPPRRMAGIARHQRQRSPASAVTFGPAFVDDADNAQRHAAAFELQSVGLVPLLDDLAHRIGQRRDIVGRIGNAREPVGVQLQPVLHGGGQVARALHVLGVRLEDRGAVLAHRLGGGADGGGFLLRRGERKPGGGGAGALAHVADEVVEIIGHIKSTRLFLSMSALRGA